MGLQLSILVSVKSFLLFLLALAAVEVPRVLQLTLDGQHLTAFHLMLREVLLLIERVFYLAALFLGALLEDLFGLAAGEVLSDFHLIAEGSVDLRSHLLWHRLDHLFLNGGRGT